MSIGLVLSLLLVVATAVVAVNPGWLDRMLRRDIDRNLGKATGETRGFIRPGTDPDELVRNLRLIAAVGCVVAITIAVGFAALG